MVTVLVPVTRILKISQRYLKDPTPTLILEIKIEKKARTRIEKLRSDRRSEIRFDPLTRNNFKKKNKEARTKREKKKNKRKEKEVQDLGPARPVCN